jgi:hypothetical protein
VEASGKETRGAGTASAVVTASLSPAEGDSTLVTMHTTMNVTGRPAQFGRGVMVEVGGKLVEKFAENLALQLTADGAAASADAAADGAAAAGDEAASANGAASSEGIAASANGAASAGSADASAGPADEAAGSGTGTADSGTAEAEQSSAASEGAATETASVVTTPPAPAQEDSLNLVRLVGPAILKRVLPVAAVIAAVALLGRRIRRGVRRAKQ